MKSSLYIESTIPSYYTSLPSRDIIILAHQEITRQWRENDLLKYDIFISELVIEEISKGVSLWSVKDESTKEFMVSFYKKVKSGKTYSEAMMKTKQEFIKNEKYSHPYFWAPFVLYGK